MSGSSAPLARIPTEAVAVPELVATLTEGRPLVPVWINGLGGLTFRDDGPSTPAGGSPSPAGGSPSPAGASALPGGGARFVKWSAAGTPELDLAAEAERLRWARAHGAAVPEVLDHGADASGSWLVTAAVAAESAVAPWWIAEPATAALALGAGLRVLHDTLPVTDCPYDWGIASRVSEFEARVAAGPAGPAALNRELHGLGIARVRALLRDAPEVVDPVVCHGDACAPNTLLDDSGGFAAHVDLGSLGVADRWADLAVAAWSTDWNYGAGYESQVYEGYGVDPDPERIAFYRLLWKVS